MPKLEYTGGVSPFQDINAFVAKVRKAHPAITDRGVDQIVKRSVGLVDKRISKRTIALFGRDIMTEDVTTLPVWPHLPKSARQRILDHPIEGGERVDSEQAKVSQLELVGRLDRRSVNRSVLISPRGLERTYAWSAAHGWTQEVTDNDYRIIVRDFGLRRLFADPDIVGPFVEVRSYDAPVKERHVARDMSDVRALRREFSRTPQFRGVDIKE